MATVKGKLKTESGDTLYPETSVDKVVGAGLQIIPLEDNGSSTAGTWLAKTDKISAYVDGQVFLYKVTVAGATTTKLNITGSGGTALGAKTVYRYGTTKLTTQYGVGQYVLLIYNSTNTCFRVIGDYDADTNTKVRQYQAGADEAGTGTKYPVLTRYNVTNVNGSYDATYARFHTGVTVDTSTGKLYVGSDEVAVKGDIPTNYVTTNTEQTISAEKTFNVSGTAILINKQASLQTDVERTLIGPAFATERYFDNAFLGRTNIDYDGVKLTPSSSVGSGVADYTKYTHGEIRHGVGTTLYTNTLPNKSGTIALTSDIPSVPTKVSDLTNDSGFITSSGVPTKVSDLTNDTGFITSSSLPTKVSDLTNDSGYITANDVPTMAESSVDVTDYSMSKVSGADDNLALPNQSQMEVLSLRGNTVAWNQLVVEVASSATIGGNVTLTKVNAHTLTISGTATSRASYGAAYSQINVQHNHKYLIMGMEKNTQNIGLIFNGYSSSGWVTVYDGEDTGEGLIVNNTNASVTKLNVEIVIESGTTLSKTYTIKPIVIDLTQLFGSGNEPTSTSDPKAQWAINYALANPAYNAGSLVNVGLYRYETVGFNQWDEEAVAGGINNSGQFVSNSSIRSNYIKVIPSTSYYVKVPSGRTVYLFFYDANKNFLESRSSVGSNAHLTPANCAFMAFQMESAYGTIYNHDICINLSSSRNGEYEPYVKHLYEVSYNGKSAGSVYDEKLADGRQITRVGSVDLGTMNYTYNAYGFNFAAYLIGSKIGTSNGICSNGFVCRSYTTTEDDGVIGFDSNGSIYIQAKQYGTDASAFKTAMSGVILNFELATPTESIGEPLPTAIAVYQEGTEWQMNSGAPCGIVKNYDISIKDQVLTNVKVDAMQEAEIQALREKDTENYLDLWAQDAKSIYHLGEYDSINVQSDGATITRQTGYRNVSKWILENASKLTFRSTAGGYQLGSDGGSGLFPKCYTSNTVMLGVVNNSSFSFGHDNTSYGNSSGYILNPNWISLPSSYSTLQSYLNYFAQNEIIVQYLVASDEYYTEKVIRERPLSTLDANGCAWEREEWEKGLNLFDGNVAVYNASENVTKLPTGFSFVNTAGDAGNPVHVGAHVKDIFPNIEVGKTYTFSCSESNVKYSEFYLYGTGSNFDWYFGQPHTFTQADLDAQLLAYGIYNQTCTISNIMLVEGTHPYPYVPYHGKTVHEKDINGTLLWENGSSTDSFSAASPTIADISNYKFLVIGYKYYGAWSVVKYAKIAVKEAGGSYRDFMLGDVNSDSSEIASRIVLINSNTQITFYDAKMNGTTNNSFIIPIAIYGTNTL